MQVWIVREQNRREASAKRIQRWYLHLHQKEQIIRACHMRFKSRMDRMYGSLDRRVLNNIAAILIQTRWRAFRQEFERCKVPYLTYKGTRLKGNPVRMTQVSKYLGQSRDRIRVAERAVLIHEFALSTLWEELRQYRRFFRNRLLHAVTKLQVCEKPLGSSLIVTHSASIAMVAEKEGKEEQVGRP